MTIEELAQIVLQKLEEHKIPYMVVGSLASNMHGAPRATQDADIVIDCDRKSLEEFMASLQPEFYADSDMARDAYRHRSMFNVIHYQSGFKVDLIIRGVSDFDQEEFRRRTRLPFQGFQRWVATPEDTILSKLEWSKLGESERQFSDAVNIAVIQASSLDREYMKRWASNLNISSLLEKLLDQVDQT